MTVDELLETLKKLNIFLTGRELAKIWGMSEENVSRMKSANKQIKLKYIEEIEKTFDICLIKKTSLAEALLSENNNSARKIPFTSNYERLGDKIEIPYWEKLPEELKNPKIVSVWFDREIIENAWKMSDDHLCVVPMVGDKMTMYWYPILPNDLLIIDTSKNYIMGNGVYFATSQNNSRFWVREMQTLLNGDVQLKGFSPSGNTTKLFTQNDLDKADFKIIGKVIKNVSFRL